MVKPGPQRPCLSPTPHIHNHCKQTFVYVAGMEPWVSCAEPYPRLTLTIPVSYLVLTFPEIVSHCRISYVAQAGLEFAIIPLPQPLEIDVCHYAQLTSHFSKGIMRQSTPNSAIHLLSGCSSLGLVCSGCVQPTAQVT